MHALHARHVQESILVTNTNEAYARRVVEDALAYRPTEAVAVFKNGMRVYEGAKLALGSGDSVVIVRPQEPSIVDELARLDQVTPVAAVIGETKGAPAPEPPDPFVIVPCVDKQHRRVNDSLVPDPTCPTCLGLGIVRVLREHVPVVHRRGSFWIRGDDAVSRLADLGIPPP